MSQIPELGYSGKCVALISVANSTLAANGNEETKLLREIERTLSTILWKKLIHIS